MKRRHLSVVVVLSAVAVGLIFRGSGGPPRSTAAAGHGAAGSPSPAMEATATRETDAPTAIAPPPSAPDDAPVAAEAPSVPAVVPHVRLEDETPPWESTPVNTRAPTPRHVPAWQLAPPRPPIASGPTLPTPTPPPNPAIFVPPSENPGGVDGARPPRPRVDPDLG